MKLSRNFSTPEDAEAHYFGRKICSLSITDKFPSVCTQTDNSDVVAEMRFILSSLPESEQLLVIGKVFHGVICKLGLEMEIPEDFISLFVASTQHLKSCGRSNILCLPRECLWECSTT